MQTQFVGALFVAPAFIGKGIGRALNFVQQRYPHLSQVYQKNVRAVNFYHSRVFALKTAPGRMILNTRRGS
jgi:putative acetyltransferase